MSKPRLPHQPVRHDASGHPDLDPRLHQLLGSLLCIRGQDLRNCVGVIIAIRVRPLAQGLNLLQLFAAQFVDILVEWQAVLFDPIPATPAQKGPEAKWETTIINKPVGGSKMLFLRREVQCLVTLRP
jgi:hypothetical protein